MAELRIAVEPERNGRTTQRVYLDGHEMSGVRRVRVHSERGCRTVSLDLDLDGASIDPRAVSEIRTVGGEDNVGITIEADNVEGPVAADLLPGWTRGRARAYRRPDGFDRARDCYARLVHVDWWVLIGVTSLVLIILGELMEHAILDYAYSLGQPADDE